MTAGTAKWVLVGLCIWAAVALRASPAMASHYRIELLEVFSAEQVEALLALGIVTTEDFLSQAETREERAALSQQAGISEMEVLVFARLCELLQISGVGPRVAQLLRAAGVVSASDLASRDPVELTERLIAVNAVEQLTGIDPAVENVVAWIEDASRVPYHVE